MRRLKARLLIALALLIAGMVTVPAYRVWVRTSYRFSGYPYAPVGSRPFEDVIAAIVPGLLDEYHTPGAAVAIIRNGESLLHRGFGVADRESGVAVSPQTAFNVGSISKTLTAVGVMNLAEHGRIGLDDPVATHLHRWHWPPSPFPVDSVTVRRLLNHSAGVSLATVMPQPGSSPLVTLEDALAGVGQPEAVRLIYEPGTRAEYSGGGYGVLQLLIEEVTEMSFARFMASEVFVPLGMTASTFDQGADAAPGEATPYAEGRPVPQARFTLAASAGLRTTLDDLTRFTRFLLQVRSGSGVSATPIEPDTIATMMTAWAPARSYGAGFQIRSIAGVSVAGHVGNNTGWMANLQVIPDRGDAIIVLTNSTEGIRVHNALVCEWLAWECGEGPEEFCQRRETVLKRLKDGLR